MQFSVHTRWNFHYLIAMKHYKWIKDEIEKILTAKVIMGIQSSWSAPITVLPKGDGGNCLVIDYHTLNKVSKKFIWPIPKVEDIFLPVKWHKLFFKHRTYKKDTTILLRMDPQSLRLHSPHHWENMSISKYLLDSHKHWHNPKDSWQAS